MAGTQYVFSSWSDGGTASHTYRRGPFGSDLHRQLPDAIPVDHCGIAVGGRNGNAGHRTFYNAGTVVPIAATANAGYVFSGWTGPVASAGNASTTATMSAALTVTANFSLVSLSPALKIVKSHTGNFAQGQTGATYTVTVSDTAGASPTSGTVTVTDTLPPGLAATAISGTGWACTLATLTCTRSDVLAAGSSYPAITVTVNVAGNATSPQVNMVSVSGGGSATAMATDSTTIVGTGVPAVSVTPTSGSGLQQTFSFLASDGVGATDLSTIYAMFNATFSGINSCMVEYSRPANTLYLLNDAGIVWSPAIIGSATVLSNSQCSVNAATTTAILSGNNLTLALPVTFASADGGAKTIWGYAAGSVANSGWQTHRRLDRSVPWACWGHGGAGIAELRQRAATDLHLPIRRRRGRQRPVHYVCLDQRHFFRDQLLPGRVLPPCQYALPAE